MTGAPVDTATVDALCRAQDIAELTERACWSAARFRSHAHSLGDERRIRAAVLCDTMAKSWDHVADSLARAARALPAPRISTPPRKPEQIQLFDHAEEPALFDI
nr:hypothetical protein [Rhodococcus sp. (in: high G+C Gram-positive bacteria)]